MDKENKKEEKKTNFIIVHSEEDFNRKCKDNNQKDSSIHFLKLDDQNQNLIWRKSRGNISDLNDFIINKQESCLTIEENKILDQITLDRTGFYTGRPDSRVKTIARISRTIKFKG